MAFSGIRAVELDFFSIMKYSGLHQRAARHKGTTSHALCLPYALMCQGRRVGSKHIGEALVKLLVLQRPREPQHILIENAASVH